MGVYRLGKWIERCWLIRLSKQSLLRLSCVVFLPFRAVILYPTVALDWEVAFSCFA